MLKQKIKGIPGNLLSIVYRFHWWFIVVSSILVICKLANIGGFSYQFFNDEPSYLLFDLSSLRSILGGHRTFGLPLVLKLYSLFFQNFRFWPYFQATFYFSCVFFLYWAFLKFGFNRILSLIVALHLIWEPSIYRNYSCIMTEPWAASFMNLTLGFLLLTFRKRNWKLYLALGFSVFFLYQIRPNCAFISILLPFWAVLIAVIFDQYNFVKIRNIFFRYSVITIIPLFLFCLLRLIVVRQFGVVAFGGTMLSTQATYYLNDDNIRHLSGESRKIAELILERKRKLRPPCNQAPFDESSVSRQERYHMQISCQGAYCMSSWLAAIKYKTSIEPFTDPAKNIEPWRHTQTLSTFFSVYNTEIDQLLMKYSRDILSLERKRYLSWIGEEIYWGFKYFIKEISAPSIRRLWIIFLAVMLLIIRPVTFWQNRKAKIKPESGQWYRQLFFITVVSFSLFLSGVILTSIFVKLDIRYLSLFTIYLFPTITLWFVPQVYL